MPGQPGVCLNKPEKFKDSTRYSLGGTWYVNPSWEARIGFAYDNSPIEPEYRSLSIPDSDRVWYSAGATYHIDHEFAHGRAIGGVLHEAEREHHGGTGQHQARNAQEGLQLAHGR